MWNNLNITKKLGLAFGAVIFTSVCVSVAVSLVLSQLSQASTWNDHTHKVLAQIEDIMAGMVNQETGLRGYLISGKENFLEPYRFGVDQTLKAVDQVRSLTADNPAQQRRLADLTQLIAQWHEAAAEPTIKLMSDQATWNEARGREAAGQGKQYMDAIRAKAAEMSGQETALLGMRSAFADWMQSLALWVLLTGGILGAGIALLMGWLFSRTVASPLSRITAAMNDIMLGKTDPKLDVLDRKDEVGALSRTANSFADATGKLRAEAAASLDRAMVERERQEREAIKARETAEDLHAISELGNGLKALADGDLTHRIVSDFAAKTRPLKQDFNEALEKLQKSMTVVATNTETIRSGTDEMSSASNDLSQRTEQQAATLEETAAALEEITTTVKQTAERAARARSVVATTKAEAENSGDIMRNAVTAINEIEQSSQQIGRIIGVIDEIAFQTNLLALNAGVEAARAGDAGKGFAVVASEVRALAQRSAEAAKEIKTLISASAAQVSQGVNLVSATGKALERIVTQVIEVNTVVNDIAASAQEQATGLAEVNTAVNQMDQVVQQNAAMVQESTAATQALARKTEELAQQIGRFEIGDRQAAARVAPAMRDGGRGPGQGSRPRSVVALKPLGRGGAAPVRQDRAEAQDWQEF